ncbi:MAG: universal stress protein [Anaerolineae bacterium]|nr:universal stress protein [Anaerolineae bacterium]
MHLLLCTDNTPSSDAALAFGIRLAQMLQAVVTVLGALEHPDHKPELVSVLDNVCVHLTEVGLDCDTVIRPEFLRRAVVSQTMSIAYDLVVVGLLERGWFLRRWLRGPSTRRILRDVAAPVLVVPNDRPAVRNILLCSGDLWYPTETIEKVQLIALATGATVTLLYVVPQPQLSYPILRDIEDAWGALLQTDTPQGRNLKLCHETLRDLGIEASIKLRHGAVMEQILAEIREGEYDLVALGSTYAAQSLRRYFVSSITDTIVEQAGRPTLVVRHR